MTRLEVAADSPYGPENLPYGVYSVGDRPPRLATRYGDDVVDLALLLGDEWFARPSLDALLADGPECWTKVRDRIGEALARDVPDEAVHAVDRVTMRLPFGVADYVDFYASEHHATNLGRILRPGQPPLTPNWKHLPVGYHGRAGTVVVSGTPVVRPSGQRRTPEDDVVFGPTERLDVEAEVGFVVGAPSTLGRPVGLADFTDHVFGVCLLDDWSARDIQAWEYVPLGPFLGKSFATSISPWVVPLAALEAARVAPPARDVELLPYLDDSGVEPWGLDLRLEVALNGTVVSRPRFDSMYWTGAQLVAHLTANGASLRTGDLLGSGTVSGPGWEERGSLVELTLGGAEPIRLDDGTTRLFLEDGDEVVISATAPGPGDAVIGLGDVRGRILPAG